MNGKSTALLKKPSHTQRHMHRRHVYASKLLICSEESSFIVSEVGGGGKRFKKVWMTGTLPHTPTHKEKQKNKNTTSKHTLCKTSFWGWRTPGGGGAFQRTLAEKQHPPVGGTSSEKAEESSVLGQWLLWAVPQGEEDCSFLLSGWRPGTVVCHDRCWEGFAKHYQAVCWKKCRQFAPWTYLSAEDDCYHVKRIVWHCGKRTYCRFGSRTWGFENGNEAGASRLSQASISDADKKLWTVNYDWLLWYTAGLLIFKRWRWTNKV